MHRVGPPSFRCTGVDAEHAHPQRIQASCIDFCEHRTDHEFRKGMSNSLEYTMPARTPEQIPRPSCGFRCSFGIQASCGLMQRTKCEFVACSVL